MELIINEEDYQKDDLWYCGKCNTPKQVLIKDKIYNCLCECEDNKYKEKEYLAIHNNKVKNIKKNISYGYDNITFNDIDRIEDEYIWAKNYIKNIDRMIKDNVGLYIYGDVGNGKTIVASAIANELAELEIRVLMMSFNEAIEKFEKYDDFKQKIYDYEVVIIDDFGTARGTDFQIERIYNLIDGRYKAKKPLIITTNIDRKDLLCKDNINIQRIYDRIIEMTHGVKVNITPQRLKMAKERFNEIENILKGNDKNDSTL